MEDLQTTHRYSMVNTYKFKDEHGFFKHIVK